MNRTVLLAVILMAILAIVSCTNNTGTVRAAIPHEDGYKQAFIYGFPMIMNYGVMYEYAVDKNSGQYKAPFNQIFNDARVSTPKDTAVVTPNSDTPCSFLWMDLRTEPMVLCVPQVERRRYYSVQLVDMYTFNYGYIGSRTTGNGSGCYMVAGPDWNGEKPVGIEKEFRSETQFSLAGYRTQLFNPADMGNVIKIQAGYKVQPLSAFLHQPAPPAARQIDFPKIDKELAKSNPFGYLNFVLQFCPPVPEETALRARFADIGIAPGKPFAADQLSETQRADMLAGMKDGYAAVEQQRGNVGKNINGWRVGSAFGDRAFFHGDYLLRAAAALAGIYGNDAVEATYPMAMKDSSGTTLDGHSHNYTLTFPANQYPPVNAFWS